MTFLEIAFNGFAIFLMAIVVMWMIAGFCYGIKHVWRFLDEEDEDVISIIKEAWEASSGRPLVKRVLAIAELITRMTILMTITAMGLLLYIFVIAPLFGVLVEAAD